MAPSGSGPSADFVSTGHLPAGDDVRALLEQAHQLFLPVDDGHTSTVYPALAQVPPDLFGISVAGVDGGRSRVGDAQTFFPIMSVAKPFVFALLCDRLGPQEAHRLIGVDATGRPFNSLAPVQEAAGGRTNPMVNSGAIATTGLTPGGTVAQRWEALVDGLSRFAGRPLELDVQTFDSASRSNQTNQRIARLLGQLGGLSGDPAEAVDLYTRQSCLSVTADDLAVMGATLADGGVNPVTGSRVVDVEACRATLAVMATAGLYETSGSWLFTVGLPAKSGIGGGIVTAAPGKGGLGTFSPRLDAAGNSVRGQLAAAFLSRRLGLDLFVSRPAIPGR